jgi:hypothetical protein
VTEQTDREPLGWCIVELMGHRRLAGHVSEQDVAGAAMLRLDIPGADGQPDITQLYSGGAVYCITPTTEDIARRVAARSRPTPVSRYELPAVSVPVEHDFSGDVEDEDEIAVPL